MELSVLAIVSETVLAGSGLGEMSRSNDTGSQVWMEDSEVSQAVVLEL